MPRGEWNSYEDVTFIYKKLFSLVFLLGNIPRQKDVGCLSLKVASVITAVFLLLCSTLHLAHAISGLLSLVPELLPAKDYAITLAFVAFICLTVVHVVSFTLNALMLLGALKEQASLIRPWITWNSFLLLTTLLLFVYNITLAMVDHIPASSLPFYIMGFLNLLIQFYMLVLVSSFYKQLVEVKDEYGKLKMADKDTWYTDV